MKELGKIKERYEFSFDARQLGLYLFAAAAIAALFFVLGMSVGVQWERKKGVEAKKPDAPAYVPAAKPVSEAPVVPAAPPVASLVTSVTPPQAAKPAAGDAPSQSLTFPKVLTSNTRKTAPMTPEKKTDGSSRNYTVQVGAYNEKAAARECADRLKKKGYDARVDVIKGAKGAYTYKVRVGSFGTRDEAKTSAGRLAAGEKLSPYVTREK